MDRNKHISWRKRIGQLLVVTSLLIAFAIIAFFAAVRFWPYPVDELQPPRSSTWITDRNGQLIGAFVGNDEIWCRPLLADGMSRHLIDAIVAVEDQRFFQHGGVDWQSAASAAWQDVLALRYRRGASTLTMQLEHLRHPVQRSLIVKLVQAIRADQIERQLTKQQILLEYLNRAPFGGNLVGAEAASLFYFGRHCADLSLGQAALLAGIPQSPARLRPDRFPRAALQRRDHVLDRMLACGMIDRTQCRQASSEPIELGRNALPQKAAKEIGLLPTLARLAYDAPGQTIQTTIDSDLQASATIAVDDQLKALAASHVSAAAVVVLNTSNAQCLTAVSRVMDRPADAVDVDLTTRARSSGSTLKPFIYAAAFDAGICTPASTLDDSPAAWSGYEPGNYDRQFDGPMPAGEALAQSRNVPALVLLSKLRVERAVEVMGGCGLSTLVKTPDRFGLSLAIGGAEVTPMELAQAYATIARGGVYRAGTLFAEVASPVVEHAHSKAVLRSSSCLMALQCIGNLDRTRRVYSPAVDLSPAWKTGTSSGHRDAWCAAVTPNRTVVVWLGNADGSGSNALVGQDAAAPLALRILTLADRSPGNGFAPPPGFLASGETKKPAMLSSELTILSPIDHQKILHDPGLTPADQRLALRAKVSAGDQQIWWFVDGTFLGSCHAGEVMWWDPKAGVHEIRVSNAAGASAVARVDVAMR